MKTTFRVGGIESRFVRCVAARRMTRIHLLTVKNRWWRMRSTNKRQDSLSVGSSFKSADQGLTRRTTDVASEPCFRSARETPRGKMGSPPNPVPRRSISAVLRFPESFRIFQTALALTCFKTELRGRKTVSYANVNLTTIQFLDY